MDEIILLNRVRVDIGNVSGSLSELMQYATLKGFNDNYEPLEKPRLVGTWTINDWYISEQLTQARNTFDGLTIVENNEFLIDFNNLAVQTLDSTLPNYNPAVAIILHNNGIGNLLDFYYHETGGKYFLTKSEAAESRNMSNKFTRKVNIADTNLIVSNTNASYTFSSFDEMLYFTNTAFWLNNQNTEHGFMYCTELVSVTFPTNVTCLGSNLNTDSYGIFYGCSKLNFPISRLANITRIPGFVNEGWGGRYGCFGGCSSLNWETISSDNLPNLTYLGSGAFMGCTKIKHVTLNLSSLNRETFYGCSGLQDLSLPNATSIPAGFCANCTSLTTLSIPQCTYIGIYAFANCRSLTTINNSTHLDELYLTCNANVGTFVKCYSLKYYASTINKEIHTQEFGGVQFMNRDLIVANSSFELTTNIKFGDCFTFQNRTNDIDTITFTNITQMCPLYFDRTSMTGNYIIRIDTDAPPILNTNYRGDWNRYPIKTNVYVGNGTASHDEALIDAYSVATNWTELYNRGMLLPWYLHEHTPALQSYDSSAPNYYPALCICFEQAGYGRYITTNNKTKGWYMSDEEAASITDTGNVLKDKSTVTDVNGICGTVGATYTLRSADLSSFTNIESIDLSGSTKMSNVTIAQNSPLSKYKLPNVEDCDWRNSGGYIESSGTQYIDTGLKFTSNNVKIKIKFQRSNNTGVTTPLSAATQDSGSPRFTIGIEQGYSNINIWWNSALSYNVDSIDKVFDIEFSYNGLNGNININNVDNLFTQSYDLTQNPNNIQLLKRSTTGSQNNSCKIWYVQIEQNGELLREMYPAIDGNGVACMYDYVSGQFFYNQGTGNFTVSNEVIDAAVHDFTPYQLSLVGLPSLDEWDDEEETGLDYGSPSKIQSLTFRDCPLINGFDLLKTIASAYNTALNTVNVTLPSAISGPIADLITITNLWNSNIGENSNLKIYGSYTVTDALPTTVQCEAIGYNPNGSTDTQMITKIYGLSVTIDRNIIIDYTNFALQSFNANETDSYNPAMCVILEQYGYGTYLDANDKTKGWYLTKQQALEFTTFANVQTPIGIAVSRLFRGAGSVTDSNGICGVKNATFDFTSNVQLKYFENVLEFKQYDFLNCSKLQIVLIPSHLTKIEAGAFGGNAIQTLYFDAINCKGGQSGAFGGTIGSVIISNSVEKIPSCILQGVSVTNDIIIPDSVTNIGYAAFRAMSSPSNFVIGKGITQMDNYEFYQSSGIISVTIKAVIPPASTNLTSFFQCGNLAHIYVPAESVNAYKSASGWSTKASIIEAIPSN